MEMGKQQEESSHAAQYTGSPPAGTGRPRRVEVKAAKPYHWTVIANTRRDLAKALLGSALPSLLPAQSAPPAGRLVPWMYMIYPLEQWLDDFRRTFASISTKHG